jgi:hypothetical protein
VHSASIFEWGGPRGGLRANLLVGAREAASPSHAAPPAPARRPGRAGPARRSLLLALLAVVIGSGASGCAASKWTVRPHQRELLADRIMSLDAIGQEQAAEQHILENREGAIGGNGTAGGGCGCN